MSSTRICDEPRCGRSTHGFSSWCTMHAQRAYMHGSPKVKHGIRESDLKRFSGWVGEGLARYRNTKATEAALKLAEDILNYKATNGYTFQRNLEYMMGILRNDQVTASDILHRVCLMVAFASASPERYSGSTKAENLAMGRMIMRLAPLQRRGKRYAARSVHLLGELARDFLYVFGLKLHERLKLDAEKLHELKKQTLDLDTPAEVPADQPRAGIRHRKRRGVQVA